MHTKFNKFLIILVGMKSDPKLAVSSVGIYTSRALMFLSADSVQRKATLSFGHKKRVSESETLSLSGGDEWARTTDSRIFSPMLYQLSYITELTRHKSKNNC